MIDYAALKTELTTDPAALGYAGLSDQAAANKLNDATLRPDAARTAMDSSEIYELTDIAEFQAKTAAQQAFVRDVWGLGGNVRVGVGSKARTVYISVFGAGSTTIANIAAAVAQKRSRAAELGLGVIAAGDVNRARTS